MKFLVLVGILVGFLSAASNLTEEEMKLENKKSHVVESIGSGEENATAHPIHEILSKLTAGLGQAVAQNEGLNINDPLKHLMNFDFIKTRDFGILAEVDANLKKALGDSESFKTFLGAADANGDNGPFNVGKMFPPKVLNEILNGKNGGFDEDAHAAVDNELSKLFGIKKEQVANFRTNIYNRFSELAKDGDLSIDELFDHRLNGKLSDL